MPRITHFSLFCLFCLFCLSLSCTKDDPETNSQFQITIEGMDPITFYNPECEFNDFTMNQQQFSFKSGTNIYTYFSSYWNTYSPDSTLNQIWFNLHFLGPLDSLEQRMEVISNTLDHEHDSNDNTHFFVEIDMDIKGTRYTNILHDLDPNTPGLETDNACYYKINLFDVDYHSKCLDEDLLVINLDFQGKLYGYDFITKIDSIEVRGENLNLLFARQ